MVITGRKKVKDSDDPEEKYIRLQQTILQSRQRFMAEDGE